MDIKGKNAKPLAVETPTPRTLADEMRAQVINGNIGHTCDTLKGLPPLVAALVAAYLYADLDAYYQGILGRALQRRIGG